MCEILPVPLFVMIIKLQWLAVSACTGAFELTTLGTWLVVEFALLLCATTSDTMVVCILHCLDGTVVYVAMTEAGTAALVAVVHYSSPSSCGGATQ